MTTAEQKARLALDVFKDLDKYGDWEDDGENPGTEIRRHLVLSEDRGNRIGVAIQEIATEYGWDGEPDTYEAEFHWETVEEAMTYLNDLLPDNVYVYQDGDFFVEQRRDKAGNVDGE